jgi:hypothetical protein
MVDWEEIEEVLIELCEDAKASSASFEELLLRYALLVDEFLADMELSKQDYRHAIQIAERYNYSSEYSQERGHDEDDEHEFAGPGD